ncbi:MAG: hypothetical protein V7784_15645 [Oceanospirillaceae bacterium]
MTASTTSTAQWSLVVQRVSQTSVQIWVGTLFPTLKKPAEAKVELSVGEDQVLQTITIGLEDWQRPFRNHAKRFYKVVTFENLNADVSYKVNFSRNTAEQELVANWQSLKKAQFSTLPNQLPSDTQKPFTIGLGSCFYNHRDGGRAAAAYKALFVNGGEKYQPDVTFLTGDQVYLDIGFDSLSLISSEIRERIADDYALHWQALGSIFTHGATWMIPDDHEYWNDYPNYKTNIPTLQALRLKSVRTAWTRAAKDAVFNVQQAQQLEIFNIGSDISFCLADLRSYRSEQRFIPVAGMTKLLKWVKDLQSPGVLVIPQPLIVNENSQEKNLRSYDQQYKALLQAMSQCLHDIVVLSGDVHFGRISQVSLGNNGNKLVEIISSPMSNLTGLNGIATATPEAEPRQFPPRSIDIPGFPSSDVQYDASYMVSTQAGRWFSAYPKERTSEHFMTVGFSKQSDGKLQLSADAWRIRQRAGEKHLPAKDFAQSFSITLS